MGGRACDYQCGISVWCSNLDRGVSRCVGSLRGAGWFRFDLGSSVLLLALPVIWTSG